MSTRYFVFSKKSFNRTGTAKALKNAATREDARDFKRNQNSPTAYGIMDRSTGEVIR
ncbi:hypothetical protein Xoosp13_125 [Xanthomonas phage Xoo-sp13]|nr:hypothetical protein Xoosp13_125 [Xanthomonas phage Xoo-sp13]